MTRQISIYRVSYNDTNTDGSPIQKSYNVLAYDAIDAGQTVERDCGTAFILITNIKFLCVLNLGSLDAINYFKNEHGI